MQTPQSTAHSIVEESRKWPGPTPPPQKEWSTQANGENGREPELEETEWTGLGTGGHSRTEYLHSGCLCAKTAILVTCAPSLSPQRREGSPRSWCLPPQPRTMPGHESLRGTEEKSDGESIHPEKVRFKFEGVESPCIAGKFMIFLLPREVGACALHAVQF